MPIIKKFKKGVYEHSNLFKIKDPIVNVGDSEVKEIMPFRGVIQTQGDIISSDDLNEIQRNSVYFVDVEYSENHGSGLDAYVVSNFQNEQDLFKGLKLKFIIPKTNIFNNPVLVLNNSSYVLKLTENEEIKPYSLKKDNIVNAVYSGDSFLVELVTESSEVISGIAKIYSESEANTDIEKIRAIVESGTGDEREFLGEDSSGPRYGESPWDKLIKILNHTKILTIKNAAKLIRKIMKPATENGYGLTTNANIKNLIRVHAPQPDLTPYIPYSKGFRNQNRTDWVVRTNNHTTWTGHVIEMWDNSVNQYKGAFHTNGARAYYKVPGRNNGNFNEIMDNHDMTIRDARLNGLDSNILQVRHLLQDVIVNHVREIRLAGYIVEQGAHERAGYVVTFTNDLGNNTVQYGRRALQFYRNGQWVNSYFA